MKTTVIGEEGKQVLLAESDEIIIADVRSALDFITEAFYGNGCSRIALNKEAVCDDFFVLRTCLAGDILQKFTNYRVKFAIYGDFSRHTGQALKDFIRESNSGNDIFFTASKEEAAAKLLSAK